MRRIGGKAVTGAMAACVLALLILATTASSQEDNRSSFGETIDVRVITLEVAVTNRDGERVTGLGPADFRVLVNGEAVPLAFFDEIRDGVFAGSIDRGSAVGPDAAAGTPAATAPDPPGVPASPAMVPNHYLVFVDDAFSLNSRRRVTLERLRDQLSQLRPEDRVALLSYDGRRLRGADRWLAPGEELEEVFEQVLAIESRGLEVLAARRQDSYTPELPGPRHPAARQNEDGFGASQPPSVFRRGLDVQVRHAVGNVILATVESLRRLDAAPGRKSVILLAGDWPGAAGGAAYGGLFDAPSDTLPREAFDLFRPLIETANLLGWTIYPAPVSSFAPSTSDSMATAGAGRSGIDRRRRNADAEARFLHWRNAGPSAGQIQIGVDSNLRYIARETGGRAALYDRRLEALELAIADTRSYYSLGFEPVRRGDDRRHRIEVEVLRPGLDARYRRGFIDISPRTARALGGFAEYVATPETDVPPP